MFFNGDIIITDPCYIMRAEHHGTTPLTEDDWEACDYGSNMEALGIHTYLTSDTLYGDWSCHTFEEGTDKALGQFCADAGLVSVFLLSEVLAYNPDFDYHLNRPWTTTLIKGFVGDIDIETVPYTWKDEDGEIYDEEEVRVIGSGSINFYTTQTGL